MVVVRVCYFVWECESLVRADGVPRACRCTMRGLAEIVWCRSLCRYAALGVELRNVFHLSPGLVHCDTPGTPDVAFSRCTATEYATVTCSEIWL